jgi:hypothetical protein
VGTARQNPTITRSPEQAGRIAKFLSIVPDCKEELADQLVSYVGELWETSGLI